MNTYTTFKLIVINYNVSVAVHFDDVVKFSVHYTVDTFAECYGEFQFDAETPSANQMPVSRTCLQVGRQIKGKQTEAIGVHFTGDGVSFSRKMRAATGK